MTLTLFLALQTTTAMQQPPQVVPSPPRPPARQIFVSPPPPPPPPPPSPPVFSSGYPMPPAYAAQMAARRLVYSFDVEIRAGQEVLWAGALRASAQRSSTYSREVSQPDEDDCGLNDYSRPSNQSSLRVSLSPQLGDKGDVERVAVMLRWQRSAEGGCERPGSRVVELNDVVPAAAGRWSTVTGDAGLVIRIRRR